MMGTLIYNNFAALLQRKNNGMVKALIRILQLPKVFLLPRCPKGAAMPMRQTFGNADSDQP